MGSYSKLDVKSDVTFVTSVWTSSVKSSSVSE